MAIVNVHYTTEEQHGKVMENNPAVVRINPSDTVFLKVNKNNDLQISVNGNTETMPVQREETPQLSRLSALSKMEEILDAMDKPCERSIDIYMSEESRRLKEIMKSAKKQEGIEIG